VFPQVCIIVLNWNGQTDTLACMDSLSRLSYPTCETVVVDNFPPRYISGVELRAYRTAADTGADLVQVGEPQDENCEP
jgi:hypothetical protein